jgi:hypothetical protein
MQDEDLTPRPQKDFIENIDMDEMLIVRIHSITFDPSSFETLQVLQKALNISQIFCCYELLNIPAEILETTSVSLPDLKNSKDICTINFGFEKGKFKEYMIDSKFLELPVTSDLKRSFEGKNEIAVYLVSEPPQSLQNSFQCVDFAKATFNLFEKRQTCELHLNNDDPEVHKLDLATQTLARLQVTISKQKRPVTVDGKKVNDTLVSPSHPPAPNSTPRLEMSPKPSSTSQTRIRAMSPTIPIQASYARLPLTSSLPGLAKPLSPSIEGLARNRVGISGSQLQLTSSRPNLAPPATEPRQRPDNSNLVSPSRIQEVQRASETSIEEWVESMFEGPEDV